LAQKLSARNFLPPLNFLVLALANLLVLARRELKAQLRFPALLKQVWQRMLLLAVRGLVVLVLMRRKFKRGKRLHRKQQILELLTREFKAFLK
jgi:hypothetical protein